MASARIYTIGHSSHPQEEFLAMLSAFGVNCIVDVRSMPMSTYNPQYNQQALQAWLKRSGIAYLHFAQEFGARQTSPDLLDDDGRLVFDKMRRTSAFGKGIERLAQGMNKGFRIALMCSEGNPLGCHRFSMVSVGLQQAGFDVAHILKDKTLKTQAELENDLLAEYEKKLPQPDLFNLTVSNQERLATAYRLKNRDIGYVAKQTVEEDAL